MNRYFACLVPATALAMILSVPAFAQPAATAPAAASAVPASAKVGIVNIQGAIVGSNEGQRDFEELQKKFDPKRQELEGLNKEVEELQKKFNTQGDKLNDEARAELLKQIDSKKKQLQRNYEDANTDIQAQQNDIANRIGQKLVSVLDKYAKANGFTVILDVSGQQSPVLWAASSVDITQAVVEAYNSESGVPAQPKKAAAAESKPAASPAAAAKK
jgi:outer membrane protein